MGRGRPVLPSSLPQSPACSFRFAPDGPDRPRRHAGGQRAGPDLLRRRDDGRAGRPARGEAAVRDWVGNGVERLVRAALTGTLDGEPDPADFEPRLSDLPASSTPTTPRALAALSRRARGHGPGWRNAGYRLGCVTNKAARFTEPLLESGLGMADAFEIVISGDTLPEKKPSPLPLLHAAAHFGVAPSRGADGRRLHQRREGGPGGGLQHRLRQLRLQSRPGHPRAARMRSSTP
jgi:hypothetical protein